MNKILNFGSLNLDYTYNVGHFVKAGETLSANALTVNCGGKGLNQSIAAARAGAKVFHAGKIGKDGVILKELLEKNGVNTDNVFLSDGANGHAIIQVSKDGQNCILLYPGANREITEAEVDAVLSRFDRDDLIILQNEINNIPYLMTEAYKKGLKIVFNPSPITDELYGYPIEKAFLLVLNEIEGAALVGTADPDEALKKLREKYPDTAYSRRNRIGILRHGRRYPSEGVSCERRRHHRRRRRHARLFRRLAD